jgi:uncharacterized protein (DUF1499 family)
VRCRGFVLAALAALVNCGGTTDPAALPGPDTVIRLLEQGNGSGAAGTSDGADDPLLRPHVYPLPPVQTAHAVVDAIDGLSRWEVVAGKDGVIWATHRSRIFRFTEDVYLLLLPAHDSTVVFARSASRAGRSDPEQNRRNLGEFWGAMGKTVNSKQ